MAKNNQLLYNISGFILKVQIIDPMSRVIYKDRCNYMNVKELNRILEVLALKFNVPIDQARKLKEETYSWLG